MRRLHGHLFNSREQSTNALLSVLLGSISLLSCGIMIYLAYKNGGQAQLRYGGVVFICLFFCIDRYHSGNSFQERAGKDVSHILHRDRAERIGFAVGICFDVPGVIAEDYASKERQGQQWLQWELSWVRIRT